MPRMML